MRIGTPPVIADVAGFAAGASGAVAALASEPVAVAAAFTSGRAATAGRQPLGRGLDRRVTVEYGSGRGHDALRRRHHRVFQDRAKRLGDGRKVQATDRRVEIVEGVLHHDRRDFCADAAHRIALVDNQGGGLSSRRWPRSYRRPAGRSFAGRSLRPKRLGPPASRRPRANGGARVRTKRSSDPCLGGRRWLGRRADSGRRPGPVPSRT